MSVDDSTTTSLTRAWQAGRLLVDIKLENSRPSFCHRSAPARGTCVAIPKARVRPPAILMSRAYRGAFGACHQAPAKTSGGRRMECLQAMFDLALLPLRMSSLGRTCGRAPKSHCLEAVTEERLLAHVRAIKRWVKFWHGGRPQLDCRCRATMDWLRTGQCLQQGMCRNLKSRFRSGACLQLLASHSQPEGLLSFSLSGSCWCCVHV